MKKILITGATGYIGGVLMNRLLSEGHEVHTLVRDAAKARWMPESVRQFTGDLFEVDALERAMQGVEEVYHVAAYARPWAPDVSTFYQINVDGAENVFRAAARKGVRRVVFTSTAGVFGPSLKGGPVHEGTERRAEIATDYERSKLKAEALVRQLVQEGQDIVIVNPSRVYGPGQLDEITGVTKMIKLHMAGQFRFFPGDGHSIGNYVFIDDVVNGHILAMERGMAGERYAIGGENASYRAFFDQLKAITGVNKRMFPLPISMMRATATFMKLRADWLGTPPMITPEWVDRFMQHWELSSEKAALQLDYKPLPLEAGLRRTVGWLQQNPK